MSINGIINHDEIYNKLFTNYSHKFVRQSQRFVHTSGPLQALKN